MWQLACDPDGNLYFTDDSRVIRVDARTHERAIIAGMGTPGFSGDGGDARHAMVAGRGWLTVGPDGNVYLLDNGNFRIRRIRFQPAASI
jgi:streptogramin lyase